MTSGYTIPLSKCFASERIARSTTVHAERATVELRLPRARTRIPKFALTVVVIASTALFAETAHAQLLLGLLEEAGEAELAIGTAGRAELIEGGTMAARRAAAPAAGRALAAEEGERSLSRRTSGEVSAKIGLNTESEKDVLSSLPPPAPNNAAGSPGAPPPYQPAPAAMAQPELPNTSRPCLPGYVAHQQPDGRILCTRIGLRMLVCPPNYPRLGWDPELGQYMCYPRVTYRAPIRLHSYSSGYPYYARR